MKFKEQVQEDINRIFSNVNEFAEEHYIDGELISVVIDDEMLKKRTNSGIYIGELLYYTEKGNFTSRPKVGDVQTFDNKQMYVTKCSYEDGMYEIMLSQNRGD